MVAAFADLQVSVVAGRELDTGLAPELGALLRHQVDKRVVRFGHMQVDRVHHLLRRMRSGDGQHAGVHLAHQVAAAVTGSGTEATGDDDFAVGRQRLADGVEALANRVIDEAAGVDDHQVGAGEGLAGLVALGAELGQDQFGVGQCLGAAKRDKADPGRRLGCGWLDQRGGHVGRSRRMHGSIVGDKRAGQRKRSARPVRTSDHAACRSRPALLTASVAAIRCKPLGSGQPGSARDLTHQRLTSLQAPNVVTQAVQHTARGVGRAP